MKVYFFVLSVVGIVAGLWLTACDMPLEIPGLPSGPAASYYTVTFDADGGTPAPAAQNVAEGAKAAEPALVEKTGFIFDGWYTDAGFTVQWDFATGAVTANCTLFAKWLPAYTVTFDAAGGTPAPSPQNIPEGGSVTQPGAMSQTGLGFDAWYVDDACTVQWDFANDTVEASITLYAKWDANYYTVDFDTGETGITIESPQSNIAFNSKAVLPVISSKLGYQFDGWYKDEDTTDLWDFDEDVVTEDIQLHLKITPIQYSIVFDANNAVEAQETMQSMPFTYDDAQDLTANAFTDSRQFYAFDNWNTEADGSGLSYTNGQNITNLTTVDNKEITLYAQWSMSVSLLQAYIISQSEGALGSSIVNPTPVVLSVELSETNWGVIHNAMAGANKFVDLDLSGCTPSTATGGGGLNADGVFNGATSYAGILKIAVLTMPDSVLSIAANSFSMGESSPYASNLTTLNLPKVQTIGNSAFSCCFSLANVSLPEATNIGNSAFSYCSSLTTISLPEAIDIGLAAFSNCSISGYPGLQNVDFPKAASIGQFAFAGSQRLTTVNIPMVTSIGPGAFNACFQNTSGNTITLGASPPALSASPPPFSTAASPITVYIPEAAAEAYTTAWKSLFKGSSSVTLTYVPYTPAALP